MSNSSGLSLSAQHWNPGLLREHVQIGMGDGLEVAEEIFKKVPSHFPAVLPRGLVIRPTPKKSTSEISVGRMTGMPLRRLFVGMAGATQESFRQGMPDQLQAER